LRERTRKERSDESDGKNEAGGGGELTLDKLDAVVRGGGGADVEDAHVLLAALEQLVHDPLAEEATAADHSVLLYMCSSQI
jgi:hypothetical protein